MTLDRLKKLRNKQSLILFDTNTKLFHRIVFNGKESFICWRWLLSKDKRKWVEQNSFLSLKEVSRVINFKNK